MNALLRVASVVALLIAPYVVEAQCGSGGAGHEHGAAAGGMVDRKTEKAIAQVLSSEQSRRALVQAVMADAYVMRLLLGRVAQDPQWRVEAADVLALPPVEAREPARLESQGAPRPPAEARPALPLYACPMHPEVTSGQPGSCPKCGMGLRRAP